MTLVEYFNNIILIILAGTTLSGIIRVYISKDISNLIGVGFPWLWYLIIFYVYPIIFSFLSFGLRNEANIVILIISGVLFFMIFPLTLLITALFFFGYICIYDDDYSCKKELPKLLSKIFKKK